MKKFNIGKKFAKEILVALKQLPQHPSCKNCSKSNNPDVCSLCQNWFEDAQDMVTIEVFKQRLEKFLKNK